MLQFAIKCIKLKTIYNFLPFVYLQHKKNVTQNINLERKKLPL